MKLNRKLVLVAALVLSVAMATGGTLAYLTDRDSEMNVLSFGNVQIELNEAFIQGSELMPGVDVEKKPTITNTGKNDAWVWATIAIPSAFDNDDASANVLHFNYDSEDVNDAEWTWMLNNEWNVKKNVKIGETNVEYNLYTILYQTALKPGETTSPVMTKVYLDPHVDIDTNGDMYHVENGIVTGPYWNVNNDDAPVMYVSAYAMQKDTFASVQEAYAAYTAQWGDLGTEYMTSVTTSEELLAAIKAGQSVKLMNDIELTERIDIEDGQEIVLDMNGKTITDNSTTSMTAYVKAGGKLTITGNGTIHKTSHNKNMLYFDGELNIMNGTFKFSPYEFGGEDCSPETCTHYNTNGTVNTLKGGGIIVGSWDAKGYLNIYDGVFDSGITNEGEPTWIMFHMINAASRPVEFLSEISIFGGQFVSANPAAGDYNAPYTLYLVGQTEKDVVPDGYTITTSSLADGRTVYTVNYEDK